MPPLPYKKKNCKKQTMLPISWWAFIYRFSFCTVTKKHQRNNINVFLILQSDRSSGLMCATWRNNLGPARESRRWLVLLPWSPSTTSLIPMAFRPPGTTGCHSTVMQWVPLMIRIKPQYDKPFWGKSQGLYVQRFLNWEQKLYFIFLLRLLLIIFGFVLIMPKSWAQLGMCLNLCKNS